MLHSVPFLSRRRLLGGLGAVSLLGGCASALDLSAPRFTLSEARLQDLVARQFPRRQRLLELIDVTLAAPRLQLLPEQDRLAADWQLEAVDRLSRTPRRGRLSMDTALRLEPSDLSLRLSQVKVQRLAFDGSAALPAFAQDLAQAVAERMLEDFTVYRMAPERLQQFQSLGFNGGSVAITARGVDIALFRPSQPAPQAAPFRLPR